MLAGLVFTIAALSCPAYYVDAAEVSTLCQAEAFLELAESDWLVASNRYADDNQMMDDTPSDPAAIAYRHAQDRYVDCLHDGGEALAIASDVSPKLVQLAVDRCAPEASIYEKAVADAPALARSPLFDAPLATRLRGRLHLLMLAKRATIMSDRR